MNDYKEENRMRVKQTEKGGIKSRLKSEIFRIYMEIQRERNFPYSLGSILISITFLQLFGYIYNSKSNYPFQNDFLSDGLSNFLELIRIYPKLEESKNQSYYLAFGYVIISVIFLYIFALVYIYFSLRVRKFYFIFPVKYVKLMSWMFYWVLLNPIIETLVSILYCENGRHIVAVEMECWTGIHIFHVFTFILAILLFLPIILLITCLFNISGSYSTDAMSRLDINLEIYLGIYKIVLAICGVFFTSTDFHYPLILLYTLASIYLIRIYFMYLPFYHSSTSVLFGAATMTYFWICLNVLICKLMQTIEYSDATMIVLIGLLLSPLIVIRLRSKRIFGLVLGTKYDTLREDYDLDIYIKTLIDLLMKQNHSEHADNIITGFLTNLMEECELEDCPLNHQNSLYVPATNSYSARQKSNLSDPLVFLHCINTIMLNYAKRTDSHSGIHIIYAYFLFYRMKNIHMALLELNTAEKLEISLQQEFSTFRLKMVIQDSLFEHYSSKAANRQIFENIDTTIVIIFENLFSKLHESIEKSAFTHIEFWSQLDALIPDLNNIHKIGLNLIKYNRECKEIWNKLIKINKRYPKALSLYGYYLSVIKNDVEEGEKLTEESRGLTLNRNILENKTDFEIMFSESTGIIIVNGNKEAQSKITRTNLFIQNIFGYSSNELLGQNINILMPDIVGEKHELFMVKYFKSGEEKMMNRERELFAKKRSGFIFSVIIILKTVPSLINGIQYIALIRGLGEDADDLILTDTQGRIKGLSEGIAGVFGVDILTHMNLHDIYIQLFCPDLLDVMHKRNRVKKTRLEVLVGNYSMHFRVPKDFLRIVESMMFNRSAIGGDSIQDLLPTLSSHMDYDSEGMHSSEAESENVKSKKSRRLPDIIVKMKEMLRSFQVEKGIGGRKNILKKAISYEECEFEKHIQCYISEIVLGSGDLKLKLFKIHKQKKFLLSLSSCYVSKDKDKNIYIESTGKNMVESMVEEEKIEKLVSISCKDTKKIEITNNRRASKINAVRLDYSAFSNIPDSSKYQKPISVENSETQMEESQKYVVPFNTNTSKVAGSYSTPSEKNNQLPEDLNPTRMVFDDNMKYENKGDDLRHSDTKVDDLIDDIGSVTTTTSNLSKFIRALRNSEYEKYNPSTISRLRLAANIVFLILLIIIMSKYFLSNTFYKDLEGITPMIDDTEERMRSVAEIGCNVRNLFLLNEDNGALIDEEARAHINYKLVGYSSNLGNNDNEEWWNYTKYSRDHIRKYTSKLKMSTNNMITKYLNIFTSKRTHEVINPQKVKVSLEHSAEAEEGLPHDYELDCWSALMSLVIHGNVACDLPLAEFTYSDESVKYVLSNAYNSLLLAVDNVFEEIMNNGERIRIKALIIFFIISILAMLLSILIIPAAFSSIRSNKQATLVLFLEIPRKNVKDELHKCKTFLNMISEKDTTYSEDEKKEETEVMDKKDETGEGEVETEKDKLLETGYIDKKKGKRTGSSRDYRSFSSYSLLLMIKFMFFIVLIWIYFLLTYFNASHFLNEVLSIMDECQLVSYRHLTNSILYKVQKELIGTNGTSFVLNEPITLNIQFWLDKVADQQTKLIHLHAANKDFNTKEYNSYFDVVIYRNMCERLYTGTELIKCTEFMGGLLTHGVHSANLDYRDVMKDISNAFMQQPPAQRSFKFLKGLLNSELMLNVEILDAKYFAQTWHELELLMEINLTSKFENEREMILVYFVIYFFIVIIVYILPWRLFLENTRHSLWTTKSLLTVIPPQVILDVKQIKDVLISSSKSKVFDMSAS